jgi:hypothetical protein
LIWKIYQMADGAANVPSNQLNCSSFAIKCGLDVGDASGLSPVRAGRSPGAVI